MHRALPIGGALVLLLCGCSSSSAPPAPAAGAPVVTPDNSCDEACHVDELAHGTFVYVTQGHSSASDETVPRTTHPFARITINNFSSRAVTWQWEIVIVPHGSVTWALTSEANFDYHSFPSRIWVLSQAQPASVRKVTVSARTTGVMLSVDWDYRRSTDHQPAAPGYYDVIVNATRNGLADTLGAAYIYLP